MARKLNIVMDQGSDFTVSFNVTGSDGLPLDMSAYTGSSQMRKNYATSNSTSFDVTLTSNGVVTLHLDSSNTANIVPGRYLYDVEITDVFDNDFRVIEGIVTVTQNITR